LGAFESNLKDLTASYTVFATGGVKLQPYLIERIADPDGQAIYKATHGKLNIVEPEAARATASLMQEVLTRGTGARARQLGLRHTAAGKTGTTNDYQDAWFVGFDDQLVCGYGSASTSRKRSCQAGRAVNQPFRYGWTSLRPNAHSSKSGAIRAAQVPLWDKGITEPS
jgi:membrane peptidoglycan carboxypeptidase